MTNGKWNMGTLFWLLIGLGLGVIKLMVFEVAYEFDFKL